MRKSLLLLNLIIGTGFICFVQQARAQISAGFSVNKTEGCTPLVVQFKDESLGNPTSWRWDLGNGTISFLQNPAATYFNPGNYTIKLVVSNGSQSDSVIRTSYITVNATPVPGFNSTDSTGCFPLLVNFTDASSPGNGLINSWLWDFGDGNTDTIPNPKHTYTNQGRFNVSLQVRNNKGCIQSITRLNYIVLDNGVKAGFTVGSSSNCRPPTPITFTNISTGTGILTYQWFFGDGGTSTVPNPIHTYTSPGTYKVILITRNNTGCADTFEINNAITIGTVIAAFSNPPTVCAANYFTLTNTSVPTPVNSVWTLSNGTTYLQNNPLIVFPIPGNYTIKLKSNFGACSDSVTHPIQVLAKPNASFNASDRFGCKPPLTVNFTSTSTGAIAYQWFFGDGSTSTIANPSHTYTSYGIFDVKLVITNISGCNDTLLLPGYIKISPTTVSLQNLPQQGCVPYNFQPALTINGVDTISSYEWNFGDGTISTLPKPSHTYIKPGTYTVKLVFTTSGGCTDSIIYTNAIQVGEKPIPGFIATPRLACAFQQIRFSDNSTGAPADQWLWEFGDGGTSTTKDPGHIYQDTGWFSVRLTVWSNGCSEKIIIPDYIYIKPPIARFTDSGSCSNKFTRKFIDHSIGATQWFWDFGDGTTNNSDQNPVHTYSNPGTYFVTLTVKNDTCEHTTQKQIRILAEKAGFSASDTVICKNNSVQFNPAGFDISSISSYKWDFGDGQQSAFANTQHTYQNAGVYSVRLIITDYNGCADTATRNQYIKVNGPTAIFTSTSPPVCRLSEITFNDGSVSDGEHPIKQWIWNYGDGTSDTLTSPPFKHTYTFAGNFTVTLSVKDSIGCSDTKVKSSLITISQPKASFLSTDTLSCTTKPIRFSNLSFGNAPLIYEWGFGNGSTSSLPQPITSYLTEGDYTIRLKVTDKFGCTDSLQKAAYIHIRDPKSLFAVSDSVATCPPLVVNFTNESLNYTQFTWDFGDGTSSNVSNPVHFYTYPGIYKAKLTILSRGGCMDTYTKTITVRGPQGSFSYDKFAGCEPTTVKFNGLTKDTVSFIWDFNDGTVIQTNDSVLSHTYSRRGIYLPKMILKDPQGCQVSIPGKDTIRIYGVSALFGVNTQVVCDSGLVRFSDSSSSNDLINSYKWDFGDGTQSNQKNPTHFYRQPGNYPIRLQVSTFLGCNDSSYLVAPVKVVISPIANIQSDSGACIPAIANFQGITIRDGGQPILWRWDFGNGTGSTTQHPGPITYSLPNNYIVKLVAASAQGCADTVTTTYHAWPVPNLDAGIRQVICRDNTTDLQGSGANEYLWSPSNSLSCSNCAAPKAHPLTNTVYHLLGKNIYGCLATDSVLIQVKQPFILSVSKGDTLCIGETLQLFASGADSYNWSPSAGLDNNRIAKPKANPTNSTLYQVIGTDTLGCFRDTGFVAIKVYPIPTVTAGADQTIAVGSSIPLSATISGDVTNVVWSPATGISCPTCRTVIASPKQTTTYSVVATNPGGCTAKDDVTVFVFCNNGNLFVPNTFSPNADGNNDVFYPRGKGIFTIVAFRVYNRWGELIFEKANFQANDPVFGWDGTIKGKAASQDVYVYTLDVMCENQTILKYNGNIALIR